MFPKKKKEKNKSLRWYQKLLSMAFLNTSTADFMDLIKSVCLRASVQGAIWLRFGSTFSDGKYAMYRDWISGIYVWWCLNFSVCSNVVRDFKYIYALSYCQFTRSLVCVCMWCAPNVISESFFLRWTVFTQNKNKKNGKACETTENVWPQNEGIR